MDRAARLSDISATDATILDVARTNAYDHYLQALLVRPRACRSACIVVAAFHGEVSRIPLLVREPMMAEIRLQWWDDLIANINSDQPGTGGAPASPLAWQLSQLIKAVPTAKSYALQLIDARRQELEPDAFADAANLARYLEAAGASPFHIIADLLAIEKTPEAVAALNGAGRAVAAAALALRLPRFAELGRSLVIPPPAHSDGNDGAARDDQLSPIRGLEHWAEDGLRSFQAARSCVSTRLLSAVLPVALVQPYFQALQAHGDHASTDGNPLTPIGRLGRLWWAARTGRMAYQI